MEVGGTALLKCGPSHSPGNFSHADWFSVSAWAPERAAGAGGSALHVAPGRSPPPCRLPLGPQGEANTHLPRASGPGPERTWGVYQNRLSLQDKGTTLALTGITPHDERIFLCQGKRPRSQEHRIQLRVYSECPVRALWAVWGFGSGGPMPLPISLPCRSSGGATHPGQCLGHFCEQ